MYSESLRKIIKYFGKEQKLKFVFFFLLALVAGFLEFLGIALVYPFVVIIVNPDSVSEYSAYIPAVLNSVKPVTLALILGLSAMLVFVLKNLYMIFYMFIQSRFLQNWTQSINNMLMNFFLYAPYNQIQKISDSDKFYAVNILTAQVTNGFIMRLLTLYTNVIIVLFVVAVILLKFPAAGVITSIFIAISVLLQNRIFKAKVENLRERLAFITKKITGVGYSIIKCIKDVKILGVEKEFYEKYKVCGIECANLYASQNFLNSISPYIVETLIVVSLIILAMVISIQNKGQGYVLVASFAVIVASIFRIAPALNRIQTSIINLPATIKFAQELILFYENNKIETFQFTGKTMNETISFKNKIALENVTFSYDEGKRVLSNISLEINKGDYVGIIGLSGAGKSTLADVITGLLPIDSGKISVDDVILDENNFRAFRKNIGYVQQDLAVLECSFRENVAWGVAPSEIDDARVEKLLKAVRLWDVVSKYDEGMYSIPFVGDSGLSRGQKQRLSIARILYRNPSILLFDEATSALDVKTEHDITSMLQELEQECTIIVIAHRLSTLQSCNKLVYLRDGNLIDIGTFAELSEKYSDFAELVRLSGIESEKNINN